MIKDYPAVFEIVKNRKNVLLLGDGLGDIGMIMGFNYDNLIKIGFLNEEVEKCLEEYKNNYDIVILNDSDMNFVNELLKDLIKA
jgi:5'-nucleotidase